MGLPFLQFSIKQPPPHRRRATQPAQQHGATATGSATQQPTGSHRPAQQQGATATGSLRHTAATGAVATNSSNRSSSNLPSKLFLSSHSFLFHTYPTSVFPFFPSVFIGLSIFPYDCLGRSCPSRLYCPFGRLLWSSFFPSSFSSFSSFFGFSLKYRFRVFPYLFYPSDSSPVSVEGGG